MADTHARLYPSLVLALLLMIGAGCGSDRTSESVWGDVVMIDFDRGSNTDTPNADQRVVEAIDRLFADHPDAPADVRRALTDIREKTHQLSVGQVTGPDADALRNELDEHWAHLRRQEVPPNYR